MSNVTPLQANFNGGEQSRRLGARQDLALHDISCAEITGWVPLVEGGLEACPGTIRVAPAKGPCRVLPFETVATQGYVIEASAGTARFFTNDAPILDGDDAPVELALPYTLDQIRALGYEQSYDVLYLFHGEKQTRLLTRTGADVFELDLLELKNGPFESRNDDEALMVAADGVQGAITLTATRAGVPEDLFEAGDVGGLFQLEADDFGDISSWEPGITVTVGQLLTWNERVYSVVGGSGRTGTVAPIHGKGVEWDGIGKGQDLNTKPAGGVQLQYMHDRFGIVRITEFTSASQVSATVLRTLPFTAATSYGYTGGYYDGDFYVPPEDSVSYSYGTWRWRFGAFSARRGWPSCGVLAFERLVLFRDASGFASVAGDLNDHSVYNELGDISADMAFSFTLPDPNRITGAVAAGDKLVILTASGAFALGASNAANGIGPNNFRVDRQNNEGAAPSRPLELDGRTLYIGRGKRRILEGSYQVQRDRQEAIDLSRYARHIGAPRFVELASQKDPNRLVWTVREDGVRAAATYVVEEQVLGWVTRPEAPGLKARSIASITDPAGELAQLWIAIEDENGDWHIVRQDQFRQEGDAVDPVMVDLAAEYEGAPATVFGPVAWLAGKTVDVQTFDVGDAAAGTNAVYLDVVVGDDGMFTIPNPAQRVAVGLRFPATFLTLPPSAGGDSGSPLGKMKRVARFVMQVLSTRGLTVQVQDGPVLPLEELQGDSTTNSGFAPHSGIRIAEDCGGHDRFGQVRVTRVAPTAATVLAVRPHLSVEPK